MWIIGQVLEPNWHVHQWCLYYSQQANLLHLTYQEEMQNLCTSDSLNFQSSIRTQSKIKKILKIVKVH